MERTSQQIRQFMHESGMSLRELRFLTGLSSSQIMDWCSGNDKVLREKHIKNLENGLCTSIQSLKEKAAINKFFFENFRGERIVVSEHYAEEARSFVRSSSHIIRYLELMFGEGRIRCILKEMSVHRSYFDELDNKINLKFFMDLLEKCKRLGLGKNDLRKVASAMFLSIEGTASEKLFKKCTNYKDAYENISDIVNLFDTNFYYDFKVSDTAVQITAEPHESIVPLLERLPVDFLFHYRRQIFGTVPRLCGLEDIQLHLDKNVNETSLKQVYHGNFPDLSSTPKFRLLQYK